MENPTVVIDTIPHDMHAHAVTWALGQKGIRSVLLLGEEYPEGASLTIRHEIPDQFEIAWVTSDSVVQFGLSDRISYWARRVRGPGTPLSLHCDDADSADRENRAMLLGMREVLAGMPNTTSINPLQAKARANSKPLQLMVAKEVGLRTPETIFTNNVSDVREFIRRTGGSAIFKSQTPMVWRQRTPDGYRSHMAYSCLIDEEAIINEESLRLCGATYQPRLPKDHEVRVTLMGSQCFASKLLSQENEETSIDWRCGQHDMPNEAINLPADITHLCVRYARRMGLLFGCFDFVVTPDGDWYFLECNEQGQWLWQEQHCPDIPVLDAFVQFIVNPSEAFRYDAQSREFRLADYAGRWREDYQTSIQKTRSIPRSHVRLEENAA